MQARQRIYDHLSGRIRSGQVGPGERMPTEKEISETFGVSRSTVQAVMARLATEGLVRRFAGRGTFACRIEDDMQVRVNLDIHNIQSFESEVAVMGERVTYRLISFSRVALPERVAGKLCVAEGTESFSLQRLRLIDGQCIGMELRYFSPSLVLNVPATALESEGVHVLLLEHLGIRIGRIDAALRAVSASDQEAGYLGVEAKAPLLVRSHTLFDLDEKVVLYGESSYVEPFSFRYTASMRS